MQPNTLYFGDNLQVLRDHFPSESVDLVYLDPPFNSARNYNMVFSGAAGEDDTAQIQAFADTWSFEGAAEAFYEITATPAAACCAASRASAAAKVDGQRCRPRHKAPLRA